MDLHRIHAAWYLPLILLVPTLALFAALISGEPIRNPGMPVPALLLLLAALLIAAAFEEVGWTAYATDLLRRQGRGPLATGAVVGVIWGLWHLIPLLEAGRGGPWIAGWFLGTVGSRLLIVQFYEWTGSVTAAVVYHGMLNLTGSLIPADPTPEMLLLGVSTLLAAVVICRKTRRQPTSQAGGSPSWESS